MDRKATAKETLKIMEQGYYEYEGKQIGIQSDMDASICASFLITPEQGAVLLEKYNKTDSTQLRETRTENLSTVDAIRKLAAEGKDNIGVLNFASAKNPGGGFINGAMAQEESLAASSTLYRTLTAHEEYYRKNRAQSSMMYTNHAIYSPDVVFFRDGRFQLVETPVKASVLTLPAVNMGQVVLKGEDTTEARRVMRRRMKLALAIFAEQGAKHLVLGAYGCGVFRNDPNLIAAWWNELLAEGMGSYFDSVFHAVLDRSKNGECIKAFENVTKSVVRKDSF
ncbi:MAG: TIGR02452 family protein [Lachnospiraceae bacterium]|nr:TIGR02452 family protein [Lachnospiraceae bacterium]MDE7272230.1 TIGR02452 family protein [Lachnospiraceae bacterium]